LRNPQLAYQVDGSILSMNFYKISGRNGKVNIEQELLGRKVFFSVSQRKPHTPLN